MKWREGMGGSEEKGKRELRSGKESRGCEGAMEREGGRSYTEWRSGRELRRARDLRSGSGRVRRSEWKSGC